MTHFPDAMDIWVDCVVGEITAMAADSDRTMCDSLAAALQGGGAKC